MVCFDQTMKGKCNMGIIGCHIQSYFIFVNDNLFIHSALQDIHNKVLEIVLDELPMESQKIPGT